jgi:hypothetical protein
VEVKDLSVKLWIYLEFLKLFLYWNFCGLFPRLVDHVGLSAHGRPGQGTAGELAGAHSTRCGGSPKFTTGWSEVRVRVGEVVPGVIGA